MAPTQRKEVMLEAVLGRQIVRVTLAVQPSGDWSLTFKPKHAKTTAGDASVMLSGVYARAMLKKAGLAK